ncbi:MAG: hypothetical protein QXM43_04815 [Desulfurococcaceae archaeon]|uniref:Uncharacterized protein n=2 Tax=Ignisphaera aggregans TaxID=334771 RepID=A0A7J3JSF5_9CREN
MGRESLIQRYIVFSSKRIGKKIRRGIDVSYVYLSEPVKGVDPVFEARVGRDYVIAFLNSVDTPYRLINNRVAVLESEDPDTYLRRLVVYLGVRQHMKNSANLIEIVQNLSEIESLFWYSRFLEAYDRIGYWGVYRVAKAFRLLYRV